MTPLRPTDWTPDGPPYFWPEGMRASPPLRGLPEPQPAMHSTKAPVVADGLGVTMADFIASASTRPDDLIPGIIPDRGLVVLAGEPRTFKTFLAVQLLLSIATRSEFLGRLPTRRGSVLYVSEEGAHGKVAERFKRASAEFPETSQVRILHRVGTTFEDPKAWARVRETLDAMESPALVVLDTLSALSTGEENSSTAMNIALRGPKALTTSAGVTVLLIHHTSKNGSGRNGKQLRGSSAIWGALDSLLFVTRDGGDALTLKLDVEPKDDEHQSLRLTWSPETFLLSLGGRPVPSPDVVQELVESIGGWVSRAQLEPALGLSKTQTSALVAAALQQGLLRDNGKKGPGIAYQSTRPDANPDDRSDDDFLGWVFEPVD